MSDDYYTEEITALKFQTLNRCMSAIAPAPVGWTLAAWFRLRGLLHWPMKATYGVGGPNSGQVVERDALPARALSRCAPIIEQLGDLGFSPLQYAISDTIGQKHQVVVLFLDQPGSTLATLVWMRMRGGEGAIDKATVEFNSYAAEDPEIMTGYVAQEELVFADMLKLAFVDTLVLSNNLRLAEVYRRHVARTEGRSCYALTAETGIEEHRKRSLRRFQWTVEQGLLRRLSPAEVARVRQLRLE
jgi:hypothetical protein